jgi:hypothetical protein
VSDARDECPCCFGILNVPSHYKLTSACRCGYPQVVTWDNFPDRSDLEKLADEAHAEQLTECVGDPLLKRRRAA